MIESFKDIYAKLDDAKETEEMDKVLREHLGIGFAECAAELSKALIERGEELLEDMPNLAPYGDYEGLIEDPEKMLAFLKDKASASENWKISFLEVKKDIDQLMELVFVNKAVDDGDILKGFVFIGLSGKIRHAFVQAHS